MKFQILDEAVWSIEKNLNNHYHKHVTGDTEFADNEFKLMREFPDEEAYKIKSEEISLLPAHHIDVDTQLQPHVIYGFLSEYKGRYRRIKVMLNPFVPNLVYVLTYSNEDDEIISFYNMTIRKMKDYLSTHYVRDLEPDE